MKLFWSSSSPGSRNTGKQEHEDVLRASSAKPAAQLHPKPVPDHSTREGAVLYPSQEGKPRSFHKGCSEVPQNKQGVRNTWGYTEDTFRSAISNPHLDPKHLAKYISSPNQHVAKQLHPRSHLPAKGPTQLCFQYLGCMKSHSRAHHRQEFNQSHELRPWGCPPPPRDHDHIPPAATAHLPQQLETKSATTLFLPSKSGVLFCALVTSAHTQQLTARRAQVRTLLHHLRC